MVDRSVIALLGSAIGVARGIELRVAPPPLAGGVAAVCANHTNGTQSETASVQPRTPPAAHAASHARAGRCRYAATGSFASLCGLHAALLRPHLSHEVCAGVGAPEQTVPSGECSLKVVAPYCFRQTCCASRGLGRGAWRCVESRGTGRSRRRRASTPARASPHPTPGTHHAFRLLHPRQPC